METYGNQGDMLLRKYPRAVGGLKTKADKEAKKKRNYQTVQALATTGITNEIPYASSVMY